MTDRTPDRDDATTPAGAAAPGDATVRLDRRLTDMVSDQPPPGPAEPDRSSGGTSSAADPPAAAPTRDDRTVDLSKRDVDRIDLGKRETETVRVDREPLSPWAPQHPGAAVPPTAQYPPAGPAGPAAGGGWPAQQPQSSWPAAAPPPPWSAPQAPPPPWGSTRAMPQPPTPPLPPPRGRGPWALIVFGVLAALVIAGGAWALISLAAGASPFGPPSDDPRADAPATSEAPTDLPLPTTEPGDPGGTAPSGGPSGQAVVNWTLDGVAYRATLTTDGPTGTAVVTYNDPEPGGGVRTVSQDLQLAGDGDRLAYVGSNPVDADTDTPATFYAPDIFLLTTNDQGQVSINEVCDTTGTCSPATME